MNSLACKVGWELFLAVKATVSQASSKVLPAFALKLLVAWTSFSWLGHASPVPETASVLHSALAGCLCTDGFLPVQGHTLVGVGLHPQKFIMLHWCVFFTTTFVVKQALHVDKNVADNATPPNTMESAQPLNPHPPHPKVGGACHLKRNRAAPAILIQVLRRQRHWLNGIGCEEQCDKNKTKFQLAATPTTSS